MTDGALETVDGHHTLRFERDLRHPIERVWRAITEPVELARWFVAPVRWRPELGETWMALGRAGEITELREPHVLAWTFGDERFRFELTPTDGGCTLVFLHTFADRSLAAQHAAGWEAYLARLDAHLDGGYLSEADAHASTGARRERYAERFASAPSATPPPPGKDDRRP